MIKSLIIINLDKIFYISGAICLIKVLYTLYTASIKSRDYIKMTGIISEQTDETFPGNDKCWKVIKYEFGGLMFQHPLAPKENAAFYPAKDTVVDIIVNHNNPKDVVLLDFKPNILLIIFGSLLIYLGTLWSV